MMKGWYIMNTYTIFYDYCPDDGYDEKNLQEDFTGTWYELQDYLKQMRINGCYNITAVAHETGLEDD